MAFSDLWSGRLPIPARSSRLLPAQKRAKKSAKRAQKEPKRAQKEPKKSQKEPKKETAHVFGCACPEPVLAKRSPFGFTRGQL